LQFTLTTFFCFLRPLNISAKLPRFYSPAIFICSRASARRKLGLNWQSKHVMRRSRPAGTSLRGPRTLRWLW
jgi:hypothetical protein